MSMTKTSSNPNDWIHFYHGTLPAGQVPPSQPQAFSMFGRVPSVSESVVVTTTMTSAIIPNPTLNPNPANTINSVASNLTIEGRVGKSARRRSRASRRAPTTLLNTDTSNFRAMVQQFTGVPTPPFSSGFRTDGSAMNYESGGHHQYQEMMRPPQSQTNYHQQQQQQQQQRQQQQGREDPMFSLGNTSEAFLPMFSNPRPNLEISDGFLDSIPSHMLLPRETSTSDITHDYIL